MIGRMRQRAWPTARGELRSALASAPYVLTLPQGMAEHTCEKQTEQLRAGEAAGAYPAVRRGCAHL